MDITQLVVLSVCCASFEKNIVKIKLTYIIPILILLISCNQKQKQIDTWNNRIAEHNAETDLELEIGKIESDNQRMVADTITNWQFYKDSELLFKSNMFDSNRFTAKIKTTDNYENLILSMFYDFNNEIIERKIELLFDEQVLATFVDENRSHSPFKIPRSEIDKIVEENIGNEIYIKYSDPINKNGLTVGMLKFIKE